jgi:hypothetical protein
MLKLCSHKLSVIKLDGNDMNYEGLVGLL